MWCIARDERHMWLLRLEPILGGVYFSLMFNAADWVAGILLSLNVRAVLHRFSERLFVIAMSEHDAVSHTSCMLPVSMSWTYPYLSAVFPPTERSHPCVAAAEALVNVPFDS